MSEMRERVARALAQTNHARDWDHMTEAGKSWWRTEAAAAIVAMREPTQAMADAGAIETSSEEDAIECWIAMINEALK